MYLLAPPLRENQAHSPSSRYPLVLSKMTIRSRFQKPPNGHSPGAERNSGIVSFDNSKGVGIRSIVMQSGMRGPRISTSLNFEPFGVLKAFTPQRCLRAEQLPLPGGCAVSLLATIAAKAGCSTCNYTLCPTRRWPSRMEEQNICIRKSVLDSQPGIPRPSKNQSMYWRRCSGFPSAIAIPGVPLLPLSPNFARKNSRLTKYQLGPE
jgi:hypothetical protein